MHKLVVRRTFLVLFLSRYHLRRDHGIIVFYGAERDLLFCIHGEDIELDV